MVLSTITQLKIQKSLQTLGKGSPPQKKEPVVLAHLTFKKKSQTNEGKNM